VAGHGEWEGGVTPRRSDDPRAAMTGWTLGSIKARGLTLEGHCQGKDCGFFATFDLDRLIANAGADYRVPEFVPGIECPECGGALKAVLAALPPGDGSKEAGAG